VVLKHKPDTAYYDWRIQLNTLAWFVTSTNILSWPPRSSTACTKCAWSTVVHRIRGALELLTFPPLLPFPDLIAPPDNVWLPLELVLNLWIWPGWWSRCCWMSRRPLCTVSWCAMSVAVSSPRHRLGSSLNPVSWQASPSTLFLPSGGEGGLMWRDRSGAVVTEAAICMLPLFWATNRELSLFLLEEREMDRSGKGSWWLGHECHRTYDSCIGGCACGWARA
jgi:hypothetical protein